MFLSLDLVKTLIQLMTSLITYFWLIPLLGFFRAWTAKKMGDNTPEMLGFLTLDPFVHTDMLGLGVLCLFGAGWGVHIPIYLNNINGNYANLKRLVVLFSDALLSFLVAVIAVVITIILGYNYSQLVVVGNQPPSALVAFYALLYTTLRLSMFLMIIDLVNNLAAFVVWLMSRRTSFYNPSVQLVLILGPLFIYMFFGSYLYMALFYGVSYISGLVLTLLGMK
jgi:hypothetical protein